MTLGIAGLLLCGLAISAPGAVPRAFPFAYEQHDFPNGLRLLTIPDDYPNVVALYIVVQAGSRNEVEPGRSGYAHLSEHLMFRGTKAYPPQKYESILQAAGASSNAYTTDDFTAYHTTFSKEDLELILRMEADRFRNLHYSLEDFRTEALAVLGEYNKNSADPMEKLEEVIRDTAFDRHTYKHTTMGFLKDVQDMPNHYDYSLLFFRRYYRPERTTIIVAGDVAKLDVKGLVEKYWGDWPRGDFRASIPQEPPSHGPRVNEVRWPTGTLPWVTVSFRGAAYSDQHKDTAALDLISFLGFSETSDLYQKLVIQEQKVDVLVADNPDRLDPYLFTVWARVKRPEDMDYVKGQILGVFDKFRRVLVPAERLEAVKSHLRYRFLLSLDNSESIAANLAPYVALRRTPETINRLYEMYSQITAEDLRSMAIKYFVESGRTIVTLKGAKSQ